MKVLLLAGGLGSRLSEETINKPKPMVEIGYKPILWHIMKIYSSYGFNDFIILLGYKGNVIKEYFVNYLLNNNDVKIDLSNGNFPILNNSRESWKVTLLDTGLYTMTGSRIKKAKNFLGSETFMLTYGDGVGDIDISKLINFHKSHGKAMTVTSAQPDGRFGSLDISKENKVLNFKEKPKGDGSWINAGFFVCEPSVLDYISDDVNTIFEQEPLINLAKNGEIFTYKHKGFWMPMDTIRDKNILENIWNSGRAPWNTWSK